MSEFSKKYTASIGFDHRLYKQDIAGSVAHAKMLAKQGIIPTEDSKLIIKSLASIREELDKGIFPWKDDVEDIHMNIEARLCEKIGPVGGKLHTARSRNDQVALDIRMYVKDTVKDTVSWIRKLQTSLLNTAEVHKNIIIPGYTHLQRAQPVLFAHHILAYFEMLERDKERLRQCFKHADVLPLGSGALAGVPYPIDRNFLARELGFSRISRNSMDAVSDRDFVVDYHTSATLTMIHLSRLAEEVWLWSSQEFGLISLDQRYVGGSSIMPQKRNPDFAELARGKTGRVIGNLVGMLTVLKGLALTYNLDLQEDKEGFFDSADTLLSTLEAFTSIVSTLKVDKQRACDLSNGGQMLATDLADYLVIKGMPFRQAHGIIKELCQYALSEDKQFHELSIEEYLSFSPLFDADVLDITVETSVDSRKIPGGTSPHQVRLALDEARKDLEEEHEL